MTEFRDLQFESWFENKLMKDTWNVSAMVNDGFTAEIVKETEKAVQIKITNTHKVLSHWELWCPKSAIKNIELLGGK